MPEEPCNCKTCARKRAYYRENPERRARTLLTAKALRENNKSFWVNRLGGKCVECGIADLRVLCFDHVGRKTREISALMTRKDPLDPLLADEMSRCRLRCFNCHTIKGIESGDLGRPIKYR